jgi:hypothetical protein
VIHLDLIDGKIWIQYEGTNWPVADELLQAGVPKEDIVLGFQPEEVVAKQAGVDKRTPSVKIVSEK